LSHADERNGPQHGDLRNALAEVGREDAGRARLEPAMPSNAVDAGIIETMDDLSHPGGRAANHLGNDHTAAVAYGKYGDSSVTAGNGITPLAS